MLTRRVLVLLGLIVLTHVVLAWLMRVPAIGWGEDDAVYSLLGRGLGAGTYREYWIVDPDARSIAVHRRTPDGAVEPAGAVSLARRDVLTSPLLPGFSLPLGELFR